MNPYKMITYVILQIAILAVVISMAKDADGDQMIGPVVVAILVDIVFTTWIVSLGLFN